MFNLAQTPERELQGRLSGKIRGLRDAIKGGA